MAVITTPMFFVAIGLLLAQGLHLLDLDLDPHLAKIIAEVTLVLVLFADASRVKLRELSLDRGRYFRLLGLGLPLTMALGALTASYVLGLSFWYAVLVGAALAPTDAALGSAVMSDRRVPKRVRHTLNVESGLNDGIATPVVTLALAALGSQAGLALRGLPSRALLGLLLGTAIGVLVGAAGGVLLRQARRYGWSSEELTGPAVLALSLLAYVVAGAPPAHGVVAAVVGGSRVRGRSGGGGGE